MTMTRELSPMKKAWADAYIETDNATEATRRVFGGQIKATETHLAKKGSTLVRDGKIKEYLQSKSMLAGSTMVSLLESKQDTVRFQSAKDLLDRTLGKASETINLNTDDKAISVNVVNVMLGRLMLGSSDTNNAVIEDKGHLNEV